MNKESDQRKESKKETKADFSLVQPQSSKQALKHLIIDPGQSLPESLMRGKKQSSDMPIRTQSTSDASQASDNNDS